MRQQEVLLAADEVMMEVAYALAAAGHRLLGVAGEEFVIEHDGPHTAEARRSVLAVVKAAAGAILGSVPAPVELADVSEW